MTGHPPPKRILAGRPIHSFIIHSFIHPFIQSCIHSFISFMHLFVHLFMHSFMHSFTIAVNYHVDRSLSSRRSFSDWKAYSVRVRAHARARARSRRRACKRARVRARVYFNRAARGSLQWWRAAWFPSKHEKKWFLSFNCATDDQ